MKSDHIIQQKSFAFAVKIVNTCKTLMSENKEFVLSKELLKSGTSVGANIEESMGAQSKADFISKLSIAYKEARETVYWLKLLLETNYLNQQTAHILINDAEEMCRITGKIQITTKSNL